MTPPPDLAHRIAALPLGTFTGQAFGRKYVVTRSLFSKGRAVKLVAEELGGKDYISLNLYALSSGPKLFPCEMPAEKVITFVRALEPNSEPYP
ncbi:hypothetical protein [Sulfitobacter noctilucicola]|uniref:Peptide methionine sulfoxide reductase n=1 Tax=Sulfitobacter noctilucicola TaxID=1342301 RepID=A0A7W6M8G1_9RHOB|nr:hypothetical protein [Sulfitobacter noctilucicola]MBB4173361.1 hypothetical protein [Sulfitobacter noctilucicola]